MIERFTIEALAEAEDYAAKAGIASARDNAEADTQAEMGKDLLAALKTEELAQSDGKASDVELERRARCLKQWTTYRQGLYEAQKKAAISKAKYAACQRLWETIQSGLSYMKAEMQRINGGT